MDVVEKRTKNGLRNNFMNATVRPIKQTEDIRNIRLQRMLEQRTRELRACKAELLKAEETNRIYRAIFELAPVGISHVSEIDGRFLLVNRGFADLTGYSVEKLLSGMTISDLVHPDDREVNGQNLQRLSGGERACQIKTRYVHRNGKVVWIEGGASLIPSSRGSKPQSVAVVQIINERSRTDREIQLGADAFRHCAKGIALIDPRIYRVMVANPAYAAVLGRTAEEVESLYIPDVFAPQEEEDRKRFLAVADDTGSVSYQSRHVRPDGTEFPVQLDIVTVKDSTGLPRFRVETLADISDQVLLETALRTSEAQLRQLADAMPQIVWTARPDGWRDYYNQRWFDFTGLQPEETQGWAWCRAVHPDDLSRCLKLWSGACLTGEEYQLEYRLKRADGQYRWYLARALPVRDTDEKIVKWFGTSTDIDDQKRASDRLEFAVQQRTSELNDQTKRAQEANRLKSVFLANMSHELRTPLNGILGFAELLHDQIPGPVNATQEDFLGDILKSSRHLLHLMNDLLDLAKIEAGKLQVHPQWLPVSELVDEVIGGLSGLALQKGIALNQNTHNLGEIWTDHRIAKQVLYNYLSNAIKFTPEHGQVTIDVRACEGQTVLLEVTDTGCGIPPEDHSRLFERFEQLEARGVLAQAGTGLGLALVKEMVALQSGSVGVKSAVGEGSRFWARWPQPLKASPPAAMQKSILPTQMAS